MPRTRRTTLKSKPEKVVYESKPKFSIFKPKNQEQATCIKTIRENDFTLVIARAGCGKTHIAAGAAAEALLNGSVDKIVITRANVGVGPTNGLLPGMLDEKFSPWVAGIIGELSYFLPVKEYIAQGKIVPQPIEFVRSMTFKNSFVIVDEIQNLDDASLKVIITRFGEDSKYVLLGDFGQSDLQYADKNDTMKRINRLIDLADSANKIGYCNLKINVRHKIIDILLSAWD